MASRDTVSSSVFLVLMTMVAAASAATYTVGDSTGWTIPGDTSFYNTWASSKTFRPNDKLVFTFPTGAHNVIVVSKKEFDACTFVSPIDSFATGPATVTLNSTGAHYFLCSIGQHCTLGQKVTINVVAATASSPPPAKSPASPAPATAAGSPPPAAGSSPLPSAGSPSGSPGGPAAAAAPSPNQKNSASSLSGSLGWATLLAVAACLAFVR